MWRIMKNLYCILLLCLTLTGCSDDYYYLKESDFDGISLNSPEKTFKLNLKVKAESKCPSVLEILLQKNVRKFNVNQHLDTIISMDWFMEPLRVKVITDSCILDTPLVGIRFLVI